MYNVVVKSVIIYNNNTWHVSHDCSNPFITLTNKLINFQKQKLRTINNAFRIFLKKLWNVETQMQFIELHIEYLKTRIKMRLLENLYKVLIETLQQNQAQADLNTRKTTSSSWHDVKRAQTRLTLKTLRWKQRHNANWWFVDRQKFQKNAAQ